MLPALHFFGGRNKTFVAQNYITNKKPVFQEQVMGDMFGFLKNRPETDISDSAYSNVGFDSDRQMTHLQSLG